MTDKTGHELLAAANPVPDIDQLEREAFSIDDIVDRLVPLDHTETGQHRWRRPMAFAGTALALLIALAAAGTLVRSSDSPSGTDAAADSDPIATDTVDFFGSASYNPFLSIHKSLVSSSHEPAFSAHLTGDVAADNIYFRLITLDSYDGNQFYASPSALAALDDPLPIDPRHAWIGPTTPATVDVEIARLRLDWLPAPSTPTAWRASEESGDVVQIRAMDGTLRLEEELTYAGMRYSIEAEFPQPDISTLISDADGSLTAAFAAASATGENVPDPVLPQEFRSSAPEPIRHTGLPTSSGLDLDALRDLAKSVTAGAGSSFERGLYLEAWFHSDAFAYSTAVEAGLDGNGISTWLLDPESPEFRVGYAEHYATAFAILARSVDVPARVVLGFAPGESPDGETIAVYDSDAHAWVELWIPQQGWLAFDPTPRAEGDTTPTFASVRQELGFDVTDR